MAELRVRRIPPIEAEIEVPGDKSMSHRAVMIAALSNGPCSLTGFLPSEDCMRTVEAMRALGVEIEQRDPTSLLVHGCRRTLRPPTGPIDCGNSGTTMRLLAGLLSAQPFHTRLIGDASLSRRPMSRVVEPLRAMGARIAATERSIDGRKRLFPPLDIEGGNLQAITHETTVASAQVKSAILLAGLFAKGRTTVVERLRSRDHTERMLNYFLVHVATRGDEISVYGGQTPESRDFAIPGDISSAAFWMVAAAAQPGSALTIKNVGLNETRTGIHSVLLRMGARVREVVEDVDQLEPRGKLEIRGANLHGTVIGAPTEQSEIPRLIDELPVLAVAGAIAQGTTEIRGAEELRVKETNRIAAVAHNLRAMGVMVEERTDGLLIQGRGTLKGARLPSYGDHRIAMAFAIAGLFADGETIIEGSECISISYPGFEDHLQEFLRARNVRSYKTPVISTVDQLDLGTEQ